MDYITTQPRLVATADLQKKQKRNVFRRLRVLYFHKEKLVILCQPKTATTALHEAIGADASIILNTPPQIKHMTYRKFMQVFAPWLERGVVFPREKYTFVAVAREPLDWLGSWYRYAQRDRLAKPRRKNHDKYTGDITFNEYLEGILMPKAQAPAFAKIGGPMAISVDHGGIIGVDHLFRYTDMDDMVEFVSAKLKRQITLPLANESVKKDLEADPQIVERIMQKYQFEYEVYNSLGPDGVVPQRFRIPANKTK